MVITDKMRFSDIPLCVRQKRELGILPNRQRAPDPIVHDWESAWELDVMREIVVL